LVTGRRHQPLWNPEHVRPHELLYGGDPDADYLPVPARGQIPPLLPPHDPRIAEITSCSCRD